MPDEPVRAASEFSFSYRHPSFVIPLRPRFCFFESPVETLTPAHIQSHFAPDYGLCYRFLFMPSAGAFSFRISALCSLL
jgi:hypothetical protein